MVEKHQFINVNDVSFAYSHNKKIFEKIHFSIEKNETVLLLGVSGAGKSTLLKLLIGLLSASSGEISINNIPIKEISLSALSYHITVSLQNPDNHIFCTNVYDEIFYGVKNLGLPEKNVQKVIQLFGLENITKKHPYDLHSTQRKLLSLASALAMHSPFFIFDEPTSGLGKKEKTIVGNALQYLQHQQNGYILITHDVAFGFAHCERIMILENGKFIVDCLLQEFITLKESFAILKQTGLQMPVAPRISHFLEHDVIAKSVEEFKIKY